MVVDFSFNKASGGAFEHNFFQGLNPGGFTRLFSISRAAFTQNMRVLPRRGRAGNKVVESNMAVSLMS